MPFEIIKLPKREGYQVRNILTGHLAAKHTTLKKAEAQVKRLRSIIEVRRLEKESANI